MDDASDLHFKAMARVDSALDAKRHGDRAAAREHYRVAYSLEVAAAVMMPIDREPARSVLYRSAAWCAVDAEMYAEAAACARLGLGGNPPPAVAGELREALAAAQAGMP